MRGVCVCDGVRVCVRMGGGDTAVCAALPGEMFAETDLTGARERGRSRGASLRLPAGVFVQMAYSL